MSIFDRISNELKGFEFNNPFEKISDVLFSQSIPEEEDIGSSGFFKSFFTPDSSGKVRVRDVARESFFALGDLGIKGLSITKDIFQGIARSGAAVGFTLLGKEGLPAPTSNRIEDQFQRIIFGDDALESLEVQTERLPDRFSEFAEQLGISQEIASKFVSPKTAPFLVVGFTALDFTGFGGGKKKLFNAIAKSDKALDIVNLIKKGIKNLSDDAIQESARVLENITDPKAVEGILKEAGEKAAKISAKVTEEIPEIPAGGTAPKNTIPFTQDTRVVSEAERGFITTIKEAPATSPEVAAKIKSTYDPISNSETLAKAFKIVDTDINEAIRFAKDTSVPATAESNAVAQLLLQRAQTAKRWDEAIELVEITANRATSQGQAIQALSMWNRLTPEGILRFSQKIINDANKTLAPGKKIKLTEEAAKDIVDSAKEIEKIVDTEKKAIATAQLLVKISSLVPATFARKLATAQILAQLLNPKTLIRNIGGNTGFSIIENMTDVFAAGLDSTLSLMTGKRSKVLPNITSQWKGLKEGLEQGIRDSLLGIDTLGVPSKFDIPKTPIFKGVVLKGAEKLLNLALRAPDRAMYKAAYDGSIYNQMRAHWKTTGKFLTEPTELMKEVAHHDGLYRTFQDNSVAAQFFTRAKKTLNLGKDFGLGDIIIKYPKTPGNLLARGLDYSPAGFVNAMFEMSRPLFGKPFNQKDFVEAFSRATVGTGGLVGMGALMHRIGIITGKREDDTDISFLQRETGLGEYRVNVSALKRFVASGLDLESAELQKGDKLITFDWFQPLAIAISMGANIDETHQKNASTGNALLGVAGTLIEGVASGIDTLGEQPLLRNLTRILKFGEASDAVTATIQQIPQSFVPTLLNQINQFVDNRSRSVYDPNILLEAYNAAKRRVPGLAQGLQPRITLFGEQSEIYQKGTNNLFNVFFNPAFVSVYDPTPEAELVLELFRTTGETKQAPRLTQKKITVNGEKILLGPKGIVMMQQFIGTETRWYFNQLANSPEFAKQTPEEKVAHMSIVLGDIGGAAKFIILGNRPNTLTQREQFIIANYQRGPFLQTNPFVVE